MLTGTGVKLILMRRSLLWIMIYVKNFMKNLARVLRNIFSTRILNNIMRTLVKNLRSEIKIYIAARQYCRAAILLSEYFSAAEIYFIVVRLDYGIRYLYAACVAAYY